MCPRNQGGAVTRRLRANDTCTEAPSWVPSGVHLSPPRRAQYQGRGAGCAFPPGCGESEQWAGGHLPPGQGGPAQDQDPRLPVLSCLGWDPAGPSRLRFSRPPAPEVPFLGKTSACPLPGKASSSTPLGLLYVHTAVWLSGRLPPPPPGVSPLRTGQSPGSLWYPWRSRRLGTGPA